MPRICTLGVCEGCLLWLLVKEPGFKVPLHYSWHGWAVPSLLDATPPPPPPVEVGRRPLGGGGGGGIGGGVQGGGSRWGNLG